MRKIKIICEGCQKSHIVTRDAEAPKKATGMRCNWCPACHDSAEADYSERYVFDRFDKPKTVRVKPGQVSMF